MILENQGLMPEISKTLNFRTFCWNYYFVHYEANFEIFPKLFLSVISYIFCAKMAFNTKNRKVLKNSRKILTLKLSVWLILLISILKIMKHLDNCSSIFQHSQKLNFKKDPLKILLMTILIIIKHLIKRSWTFWKTIKNWLIRSKIAKNVRCVTYIFVLIQIFENWQNFKLWNISFKYL